jgi:hypothetical protein
MGRSEEYVSSLNDLVGTAIGRRLLSVVYRAIENECTTEDVAAGIGWIGGEIQLQFEGSDPFFIGWGENQGWSDHFSLAVQPTSTFLPNALVPFPADHTPEWSPHVGKNLLGVTCRGSSGSPHALIFRFPEGDVVVGDGYHTNIGDGDDVTILPVEKCDLTELTRVWWTSGANAP